MDSGAIAESAQSTSVDVAHTLLCNLLEVGGTKGLAFSALLAGSAYALVQATTRNLFGFAHGRNLFFGVGHHPKSSVKATTQNLFGAQGLAFWRKGPRSLAQRASLFGTKGLAFGEGHHPVVFVFCFLLIGVPGHHSRKPNHTYVRITLAVCRGTTPGNQTTPMQECPDMHCNMKTM